MPSTTILYDGWPVVYDPYSPAAIHLKALLAHLPGSQEAVVALPGPGPAWLGNTRTHLRPTPASESGRLLWEQRLLTQIAGRVGAQILHTTTPAAPLLGKLIRVTSPGTFEEVDLAARQKPRPARERAEEKLPLAARLRLSLGRGGLARARAIFWPEDLPNPDLPIPVVKLPPVVHPSFTWVLDEPIRSGMAVRGSNGHPRLETEDIADPGPGGQAHFSAAFDLPERYVLYHGPVSLHWLQRLLECWQWASGPIGDQYPLVILGMPEKRCEAFHGLVKRFNLEETVLSIPAFPVEALSTVYRGCSVYFHPAPFSPWGGPVRNALACGKPVVAAESPLVDAIVGPAAYLAPGEDPRALGAALLTVIVEEEVASELAQNARQRSSAWRGPAFSQALNEAYHQILSV